MTRIKNGVRFADPGIAMCHASMVVADVCREFAVEFVVTCGIEQHQHPSMHAYNAALDYRTRDILGPPGHGPQGRKSAFAETVRDRLGDGFDVVLEPDHLHVEYDPKD